MLSNPLSVIIPCISAHGSDGFQFHEAGIHSVINRLSQTIDGMFKTSMSFLLNAENSLFFCD